MADRRSISQHSFKIMGANKDQFIKDREDEILAEIEQREKQFLINNSKKQEMEKSSKVLSVKFKNEFNSQYGLIYNFDIEFENGDKGQYGSKKNPQTHFKEGEETNYETFDNKGYIKIKPVQTQVQGSFGGGYAKKPYDPQADNFRQALIVAQSSMTKAVELWVHGKIEDKMLQPTCDRLMQIQFDLAKKFSNEVNKPAEL